MLLQEQDRKVSVPGRGDRVWLSGLPFAGGKWPAGRAPNQDSLIWLENSLIPRFNSLLRRKKSLFRCVGNFRVSHWIYYGIWHHLAALQGQTVKIPCFFPASREFWGFRD